MNNADILLISETKLDSSFPDAQCFIECYNKPLRLHVSRRSRVFMKWHLPSRQLTKIKIPRDIQIVTFKLNLRKETWLVVSVYKLHAQHATTFLNRLFQIIDVYSIKYEKQVIIDFNLTPNNKSRREFVDLYSLINFIKTTSCFKGSIDNLLKIQTYLKLAIVIIICKFNQCLKLLFRKKSQIGYRDYTAFSKD